MTKYQQKQTKEEVILVDSLLVQSNMEAAAHSLCSEDPEKYLVSLLLSPWLVPEPMEWCQPVMVDLLTYVQSLQSTLTDIWF